jgi:hypothetical protein
MATASTMEIIGELSLLLHIEKTERVVANIPQVRCPTRGYDLVLGNTVKMMIVWNMLVQIMIGHYELKLHKTKTQS